MKKLRFYIFIVIVFFGAELLLGLPTQLHAHEGDDEQQMGQEAMEVIVRSYDPNVFNLDFQLIQCPLTGHDMTSELSRSQLCDSANVIRKDGRYDANRQDLGRQLCDNQNTDDVEAAFEEVEHAADEQMNPLNHRINRELVNDPNLLDTYWQMTQTIPPFCMDPNYVGDEVAATVSSNKIQLTRELRNYRTASGYEPWSWPDEDEYVRQQTEYLFQLRLQAGTLYCSDEYYAPPLPGSGGSRISFASDRDPRPTADSFRCNAIARLDYTCPRYLNSDCETRLRCIRVNIDQETCQAQLDQICAQNREAAAVVCRENYEEKCEEYRIQWTTELERRRQQTDKRYQRCLTEKRQEIQREVSSHLIRDPWAEEEGRDVSEYERRKRMSRESSEQHALETARTNIRELLSECQSAYNQNTANTNFSDYEEDIMTNGCSAEQLQGDSLRACLFWRHRKTLAQEVQDSYSLLYYGEDGGQAACTRETGNANICSTIAQQGNTQTTIDSIYSPDRMEKLSRLIDRTKQQYREYFNNLEQRGKITEQAKAAIMQRLDRMSAIKPSNFTQMFHARNANGFFYRAHCAEGTILDLTERVDRYECDHTGLVIGPQLMLALDRPDGADLLAHIVAHEVGHGVIAAPEVNHSPWDALTSCLARAHSHNSISAPCSSGTVTCESNRENDLNTLKRESLADYLAAEVIGRELRSRRQQGEASDSILESAERMILRSCIHRRHPSQIQLGRCTRQRSPDRSTCHSDHPQSDDRLTSLLAHPQMQQAMGCSIDSRRRAREQTCAP